MPSQNMYVKFQVVTAGLASGLGKAKTSMMSADKTITKGLGGWYNSIRKVNQATVNLNKDLNRAGNGMSGLGKGMGGLGTVGKIGMLYMAVRTVGKYINSSMEMIETQNLFNVSMRSTAVETGTLVDKMSELYGLDPTNLKNAMGTYSLLARSMGMGAEQSAKLATNTTQLAVDLSSLMNIPIQQVMSDLRSGLVGQSETVYKYGMDVTEAGLKAEALAQGITKSVRNMSQGEKMALRASVMVKQGFLASGDFAKTLETPANQLKILGERMVTFGRSIGSIFMPMIGAVLPYLNAFVAVLIRGANALAKLFGYVAPKNENLSENIGGISEEADNATDSINGMAKAIKNATLGLDELHVMEEPKSASAGTGVGGASIIDQIDVGNYSSMMDQIKSKTNDLRDNMLKSFEDFKKGIDFTNIKNSFDNLWDSLTPFSKPIGEGLTWLWNEILKPLAEWTIEDLLPNFLDALASCLDTLYIAIDVIKPLLKWLWEESLQPLLAFTGGLIVKWLEGFSGGINNAGKAIENQKAKMYILLGILGAFAFALNPIPVAIGLVVVAFGWLIKNWDTFTYNFGRGWFTFWITMGNFLVNITRGMLTPIQDFVNGTIKAFNKLMTLTNQPNKVITWKMDVKIITPEWKMPKEFVSKSYAGTQYASGGMPPTGQMFIAREAGAELVGNIGGKTAVMNNDQIVEAVATGVARAVSATLGDQSERPIVVNLDGEVIYTNQQKISQTRGANLGLGVFAR